MAEIKTYENFLEDLNKTMDARRAAHVSPILEILGERKYSVGKKMKDGKHVLMTLGELTKHITVVRNGFEHIPEEGGAIPYGDQDDKKYKTMEEIEKNYQSLATQLYVDCKAKYGQNCRVYLLESCGIAVDDEGKSFPKLSFHYKIRGAGYYAHCKDIPRIPYCDQSVYRNGCNNLFRLPYCTKEGQDRPAIPIKMIDGKWTRIPLVDLAKHGDKLEDYLITNIDGEELVGPQPRCETPTPETKGDGDDFEAIKNVPGQAKYNVDHITRMVKCLSKKRATDRKTWIETCWCLGNIARRGIIDLSALCHEFSKNCEDPDNTYSKEHTQKEYDYIPKGDKLPLLPKLESWANEDNPLEYEKAMKLLRNEKDPSDFVFKKFRDYTQMVNKNVSLETVEAWANASIARIDNGGNPIFMTKNTRYDDTTKSTTTYYEYVKKKQLLEGLECSVTTTIEFYKTKEQRFIGRPKQVRSLAEALAFLIFKNRIKHYNMVDFYPYLKDAPELEDTFNTFGGFAGSTLPETKKKFEDTHLYAHIRDHLCNGEPEAFVYLMMWIAHMFQFPGACAMAAVFIYGLEGEGKDLFARFIATVMGHQYYVVYNNIDAYFNAFNALKENKLLCTLNEVQEKGVNNRHDQFKDEITQEDEIITRKHQDPVKRRHVKRYLIFSNHENAMYVTPNDRRIVMIRCSGKVANDAKHFEPIIAETKNPEVVRAAFNYFTTLDISKYNPRVMVKTAFKSEQCIANLPIPIKFMIKFIAKEYIIQLPETGYTIWTVDEKTGENVMTVRLEDWYKSFQLYWVAAGHSKTNCTTTLDTFKKHVKDLKMDPTIRRSVLINELAEKKTIAVIRYTVTELREMFRVFLREPKFEF